MHGCLGFTCDKLNECLGQHVIKISMIISLLALYDVVGDIYFLRNFLRLVAFTKVSFRQSPGRRIAQCSNIYNEVDSIDFLFNKTNTIAATYSKKMLQNHTTDNETFSINLNYIDDNPPSNETRITNFNVNFIHDVSYCPPDQVFPVKINQFKYEEHSYFPMEEWIGGYSCNELSKMGYKNVLKLLQNQIGSGHRMTKQFECYNIACNNCKHACITPWYRLYSAIYYSTHFESRYFKSTSLVTMIDGYSSSGLLWCNRDDTMYVEEMRKCERLRTETGIDYDCSYNPDPYILCIFSQVLLCFVLVKELLKICFLLLFFLSKHFRRKTTATIFLNSPLTWIFIPFSSRLRDIIVEIRQTKKRMTLRRFLDIFFEDLPCLYLPIWYIFLTNRWPLIVVFSLSGPIILLIRNGYIFICDTISEYKDGTDSRLPNRQQSGNGSHHAQAPSQSISPSNNNHSQRNIDTQSELFEMISGLQNEMQQLVQRVSTVEDTINAIKQNSNNGTNHSDANDNDHDESDNSQVHCQLLGSQT